VILAYGLSNSTNCNDLECFWRSFPYCKPFQVQYLPSVLWCCWLGSRKGIRPVKNRVVGCWRGCLGWGADLHIAQQIPLPLTISCSSKYRLVLTFLVLPFWYLLARVVPDIFQKSSKMIVCVCACVQVHRGAVYKSTSVFKCNISYLWCVKQSLCIYGASCSQKYHETITNLAISDMLIAAQK